MIGRKNSTDFTRDRVLTFAKLTTFIVNLAKRSLQIELYSFTNWLSMPDITKQAFSKARKKLSPEVFKLLAQKLIIEYYSNNKINTFKGLRILALDGSTLRLPREKQLFEKYGCDSQRNGVPLARVSIIFDVLNNMALDSHLDKFLSSEREMAYRHLQSLAQMAEDMTDVSYTNDLIIFDRGYQSLFLMYYILSIGRHFLMRVTEKFVSEIIHVLRSGAEDVLILIDAFATDRRKPSDDFAKYLPDIEKKSIQVRVLTFHLSSGQTEVIVTSLLDKDSFSYDEIFKLYSRRWDIEEQYKYYKQITEVENFSGKTPVAIEQDFYATIFAGNINAMLMQEAQDEVEEERKELKYKRSYKINKNVVVGVIKNEIIDVLLGSGDLEAYCEKLKEKIKKNLVPIVPNRGFPRIYKRVRYKVNRRAL